MDTLVHVLAIVGSAVGATWVLSMKLSAIEVALTSLGSRIANVEGKVVKLEEARRKRR